MILEEQNILQSFLCIGVSYRNTTAEDRSKYAIDNEAYEKMLESASDYGIDSLFVLSTCNRTEIYAIAKDPTLVMGLMCKYSNGSVSELSQIAYVKHSTKAIQHLFNVAGGIDSQILGDYEIVGQLKTAFNFSKSNGKTCSFLDRMFNTVLQASRAIRSKTELSSGTVSVAYAAVLFIKEHFPLLDAQKVLVIGTGDIGRNTCKNLLQEYSQLQLTVINRTEDTAQAFAKELGIQWAPYTKLQQEIDKAEIIIVATNAQNFIVTADMVTDNSFKTIIDLSIPNNVEPSVGLKPTVTLANVDDLSKINDETLKRREEEVPKAKAIITFYIHEFAEWYIMRQNVPVLKAAKEKILELNGQLSSSDFDNKDFSQKMQKVLNNMALKLKEENRPGCTYLEAMYNYVQLSPNTNENLICNRPIN